MSDVTLTVSNQSNKSQNVFGTCRLTPSGWINKSVAQKAQREAARPLPSALTLHVEAFQSGQRPSSQGLSQVVSEKTLCVCVSVSVRPSLHVFRAMTVRSKQCLTARSLTLFLLADSGYCCIADLRLLEASAFVCCLCCCEHVKRAENICHFCIESVFNRTLKKIMYLSSFVF